MKFGPILKALVPVLAVALAAGVSGCDDAKFSINGEEGKKLAELDLTGKTPSELVLLGPDSVEVKQGDAALVLGQEEVRIGRFPSVMHPKPIGGGMTDAFLQFLIHEGSGLVHIHGFTGREGIATDHPPAGRADGFHGQAPASLLRSS